MKILLFNWNGIMDDLAHELKKRGHEVEVRGLDIKGWEKYDTLVFWNEIESMGWADVIKKAQKLGKKTVLLQHGRRGTSRIFPPFNEGLKSDVICCWGEGDRERLLSCGVPDEKIKVTGCPLFKKLKPRKQHTGFNVVFSPEHWTGEVPENFIVASELRKLKDVNIITKCLDGTSFKEMYDNVVSSDRNKPKHFEVVAEVLSQADVVVGISESTFEMFAEYLDIPVVAFTKWIPKPAGGDERYRQYKRIYSQGCYQVNDLKKLNKTIKRALRKPKEMAFPREKAVHYDGGVHIEDPVLKVIEVIES